MSRSKETFGKKEVRTKKEKKRKLKEKRRVEKKEQGKKGDFDDMIAWVDENGNIVSAPPDLSEKTEIEVGSIEISVPKAEFREDTKLQRGKVLNFDSSKGYGFINGPQLNDSVFFHVNDCIDEVKNGDKVEFETEKGLKGLKAINVKKVVS